MFINIVKNGLKLEELYKDKLRNFVVYKGEYI
jgi:hypothetical protein